MKVIRLFRPLSMILAFLLLGASFITLCSAKEAQNSVVHFISNTCADHNCESHDISINNELQSCTGQNCQHHICSIQSVISECLPKNSNQVHLVCPPLISITNIFFSSKLQNISLVSLLDSPFDFAKRTQILRI